MEKKPKADEQWLALVRRPLGNDTYSHVVEASGVGTPHTLADAAHKPEHLRTRRQDD